MDTFIIKKPLITEKSTDSGKLGKYVFVVENYATKPEIKKAIKQMYKVDAVSVNIIKRPSKRKRMGNVKGHQKGYKKAIVTLKKGQKIEMQ